MKLIPGKLYKAKEAMLHCYVLKNSSSPFSLSQKHNYGAVKKGEILLYVLEENVQKAVGRYFFRFLTTFQGKSIVIDFSPAETHHIGIFLDLFFERAK